MRRAWTWFRSLEGWAQASLASATSAALWFLISWMPSLISGEPDAPGRYLAGVALIYWTGLILWSVRHFYDELEPPGYGPLLRKARVDKMLGIYIAFEAIALSVDALLTAATTLVRHLARRLRSRLTGTEEPPT